MFFPFNNSMERIDFYIDTVAKLIEVIGVITILIGTVIALGSFVYSLKKKLPNSFTKLRHQLGKAILLGLEILVAADIIATVVTEPTMDRVLTLGVVVLIRTFLSLSIQVEIDHKFPWQKKGREE